MYYLIYDVVFSNCQCFSLLFETNIIVYLKLVDMVLGSYKAEAMGTAIFGLVCGRGGILCVFGGLVIFVLGLSGLFII